MDVTAWWGRFGTNTASYVFSDYFVAERLVVFGWGAVIFCKREIAKEERQVKVGEGRLRICVGDFGKRDETTTG